MVDFPEMMAWPKPVQKAHPPILVGGGFPQAARRAVRYGDGWAPIAGRGTQGDIDPLLPRFHQMLSEAGRDPATVAVALFHVSGGAEQLRAIAMRVSREQSCCSGRRTAIRFCRSSIVVLN